MDARDATPKYGSQGEPTRTHELLSRYLGGDHAAEERLFSRVRAELLERARRHPRMRPLERELAPEDAVQEVFRRALASGMLRDFEDRGRGSLEAALSKVLDNTLVDMARRMSAQKRGGASARAGADDGEDSLLSQLPSDETTPTSNARAHELVALARAVLEPRELEIWTAVELDEHDSVEVAARLGTSSSAVRGVLFRAQRKLLEALERGRGDLRS